jgi:hypothetical protein
MQNKPNFKNAQINTCPFIQKTYEKYCPLRPLKNEPKTNPKRTQTKPNSKMTKINAKPLIQRDYEQKMVISHQKNEPKTNPICRKAKNEHKPLLHKGLRKCMPSECQKNEPKQTQFPKCKGVFQRICLLDLSKSFSIMHKERLSSA